MLCICIECLWRPEGGIGSSGAGVLRGCEAPSVGAENQNESSKH